MTGVTPDPELHMVGLIVKDVDASLVFYRSLGLAPPETPLRHHLQFQTRSGVTLFVDDEPSDWDPQFSEKPYGWLVEFFLGSEDAVRAKVALMEDEGYRPVRAPYVTRYGMCFAMFEDPDGNTILLSGTAAED